MIEVKDKYVSRHFPPLPPMPPEEFFAEQDRVMELMVASGDWFEDGTSYRFRRAEGRSIALGRKLWYGPFADFLFEKYGRRFYLLDFMVRADFAGPGSGLLYYILSAEEIHVSLAGLTPRQVWQATLGLGRPMSSSADLKGQPMTLWEINQIFFRERLERTIFHMGSGLSRLLFWLALGGRVPMERLKTDLPPECYRRIK